MQRLFRVQLAPEAMPAVRAAPRRRGGWWSSTPRPWPFGGATAASRGGDGEAREPRRPAAVPPAAPASRCGSGRGWDATIPCPCGSGKKYKKCHMLIDQGVESGA